jgi:DNA-binding transcriptional LysR family regulator
LTRCCEPNLFFLCFEGAFMPVEIQQLRGFYYSAKLGSFSKAAKKLSLTQSAVSQQVKALEEKLEVYLFDRYGPKMELTLDGEIFLDLITSIVESMESLQSTFEDLKGQSKGTVTFAATTMMIMDVLPYIVKKFKKRFPQVKINILERRWNEVVSLAQAGEIDFGLSPVKDMPQNLIFLELKPLTRVLITSRDHPLSLQKQVDLEDVAKYPVIAYESGTITRGEFDRVFKEANLDLDIVMEATNVETIKRYVEMGIGIAIVPRVALFQSRSHDLSIITVNGYPEKMGYGIVLKKGKHLTSWTKNFLLLLHPDLDHLLDKQKLGNARHERIA